MSPSGPRGTRALVLLSGGIDSAVALYWARERKWDVEALTFDYSGRPEREAAATVALARAVGVPLHRAPVPWMMEAGDLPPELRKEPALEAAPEGYVPARNLAFYAIAAYYAEALGARRVVGGHHGADADRFPDASPDFFRAFEHAANLGLWSRAREPLTVQLPLRGLVKRQVLDMGFALRVPFEATWSCYWDRTEEPCGQCQSCAERASAFAAAGRPDPLVA